jgi:hypothetical protein
VWDEASNPARGVVDLRDYMGGMLPALLYYAHYENRTSHTQVLKFPDLYLDTLMPLWGVLQRTMVTGNATVALTIAMHAVLQSVVSVNGDRSCLRVQVAFRSCVSTMRTQLRRDGELFATKAPHMKANVDMIASWLQRTDERARTLPVNGSPLLESIAKRQRDHSLLQNPYVAGQQLLVAALAVPLGLGLTMVDCLAQTRTLLHLYNALRVTGFVEELPLLEMLLRAFKSGSTLWFLGRPNTDFVKHWYHAMGMKADTRADASNRKLEPFEPQDVSTAFRCAALSDYSTFPIGEDGGFHASLQAIREAFSTDKLIGVNMVAIGAHFLTVLASLVDALGLGEQMMRAKSEQKVKNAPGKRHGKKGASTKEYRDVNEAVNETLVHTILRKCDAWIGGPVSLPKGLQHMRKELASIEQSDPDRVFLQRAAASLTGSVLAFKESSYCLPLI